MKEEKKQKMDMATALNFDSRLQQARVYWQNILLVKWLLMAVSVTLLALYLFTPLYDLIVAS